MVSQVLIAISLLVVPAASVQHTVQVFEGIQPGCTVLDTTYTGVDLMAGTSCKQVVSDSTDKGKSTVGLKYIGAQEALKFKVHSTCEDIDGMTVVLEASEAESAKILAGDCGEVMSYFGDEKGTKSDFEIKLYMKITTGTNSEAPTTTAANVAPPASTDVQDGSKQETKKPDAIPDQADKPEALAQANATAAVAVTDQAESTNMLMPMVSVVLARMLLAY